MGAILTGYGDAGYDHEGYAAWVLDDGTITGTSSPQTRPQMTGQVVAACGCGWAGTTRYPCPTSPATGSGLDKRQQAEALALAEWEATHARPVLGRIQQDRVNRLQRLLARLADEHRVHLTGLAGRLPGQRLELLDRTVRTLLAAADIARKLRDEAAEVEQVCGRG